MKVIPVKAKSKIEFEWVLVGSAIVGHAFLLLVALATKGRANAGLIVSLSALANLVILIAIPRSGAGENILSSLRGFTACTEPPKFAAFLMFMAFPRQHREATIGDFDEDYRTHVLPRFGRVAASIWYAYKALLCIALYRRAAMRKKPYWRRLLSPAVKYFLAPVLVANRLGWISELITILRAHHLL